MDKVIITCALTGAQQGKEANPNLPTQPEEIIDQAVESWRAGASIIHIHARDRKDRPTSEVGIFRQIADGIRARGCDVVLNLSTGGAIAGLPLGERIAMVPALEPEIASFSVGSGMMGRWNPQKACWERQFNLVQSYDDLAFIARTMLEHGTKPEMEVYDLGMVNNIEMLLEAALLEPPLLVNFVTGIPGQSLKPTVENLVYVVGRLPEDSCWLVSSIGGRNHWRMMAAALAMGGHVRTGLEDNVYVEKDDLARDNAQLVEKVVGLVRLVGREPATSAETRALLKLRGSK
jgi:3-keto-5-aminohexanoate cleavage enzyme